MPDPSDIRTSRGGADRIDLLMFDATGSGGVARTVTMLANRLAASHEVHVHSVFRNADLAPYPLDERVSVTWLVDNRRGRGRRRRPRHDWSARPRLRHLDSEPSALEPDDEAVSAYTDVLLEELLSGLPPGPVITTRPMLHLAAARWAAPGSRLIAQEHTNFEVRMRNRVVTAMLDEAVPAADVFVTLTEADRRDYQRRYPSARIERIPNASPFDLRVPASLSSKVIVAAGRLVHRKGFDRLIAAWAPLAGEFPDWRLDIHGEGECRTALERQVIGLGLTASVRLPGFASDLDAVLADAAGFVLSSRVEGFPMVLLEAMSHGLPLVAFDCPRGPAEIVEDGVSGRLVPNGDVGGLTRALRELMSDDDARHRWGSASRARAAAYQPDVVMQRWEALLDGVSAATPAPVP